MQLDLFEDNSKKENVMNSHMFFIHETDDEYRFPVIGFQNMDADGNPYIPVEQFNMFAVSILEVVARSMPNKQFKIDWNDE